MSLKAFYQTFYQNEQLFRLDEPPAMAVAQSEEVAIIAKLKTPDLEPITIVEPAVLVPPVSIPQSPVPPVTKTPDQKPAIPIEPIEVAPPAAAPQAPLISIEKQERPSAPKPPQPVAQLNHKVLILADEELDPSDLLFLEKILKAVNLNINGVELLNLHGVAHIDFAELLRGKHIHHFITFGVPFKRLNLDIMMDRYSPVRFEGITFLMADSLPTIEADQNLKRSLWNSLKRVFSLS